MPQACVLVNWEILRDLLMWPAESQLVAVGMSYPDVISFVVDSAAIPPDTPRADAVYHDSDTPADRGFQTNARFSGFQVPGASTDATNEQ